MATAGFYVYEHLRGDSGAVFYVGKGKGDRLASENSRNRHWRNIVGKHGFSARTVFKTDDEELAFFAEQELIAKYRREGVRLSNMTDGGEGVSGLHRKQRQEEIERRRAANTGQKRTPEQRSRIAAAKRGHGKGRKHDAETRRKISDSQRGRPNPMDRLKGRPRPAHVIDALKTANDLRYAQQREALRQAIERNPNASSMELARATGCNRGTVSAYKKLLAARGQ